MKQIISLGSMCWTRWLIDTAQSSGTETLPFDWVNSHTIYNIHNVINDLLEDKIDYEQFVVFDENHFNHYGMWFGHYDPQPKSQKDTNLIVFKRRLQRFKNIFLDDQIVKMFVYYNREVDKLDKFQETLTYCENILNKSKNSNNLFLIINHTKPVCNYNQNNNRIITVDLDFCALDRDKDNKKIHLTYKDHLVPACKNAKVMDILMRFMTDN